MGVCFCCTDGWIIWALSVLYALCFCWSFLSHAFVFFLMLSRSVFCFGITGSSLKPSPTIQMATWQPWHSPKDWHEMTLKFMPSNSDQWGDDIVAKRSSKDRGTTCFCAKNLLKHTPVVEVPRYPGSPVPQSPKSSCWHSFSILFPYGNWSFRGQEQTPRRPKPLPAIRDLADLDCDEFMESQYWESLEVPEGWKDLKDERKDSARYMKSCTLLY